MGIKNDAKMTQDPWPTTSRFTLCKNQIATNIGFIALNLGVQPMMWNLGTKDSLADLKKCPKKALKL